MQMSPSALSAASARTGLSLPLPLAASAVPSAFTLALQSLRHGRTTQPPLQPGGSQVIPVSSSLCDTTVSDDLGGQIMAEGMLERNARMLFVYWRQVCLVSELIGTEFGSSCHCAGILSVEI